MSTKHTPGPWRWSAVGPATFELAAGIERVLYQRGDKTGFEHGTINADQVDGPDARLIAAAPELLAALERLINCYSSSHSSEIRQSCWDQASSAVSKATGKSP